MVGVGAVMAKGTFEQNACVMGSGKGVSNGERVSLSLASPSPMCAHVNGYWSGVTT